VKKLFLLPVILLFSASVAHAKFDPAFTWTTLETPHFLIHFHQGEEEIAKRTAVIAEDVHDRLVPRIKWDPKGRTHLVLVDAMDDSNGLTTPFPYNHITLFITQPAGEPGFGTTAYDEWMRLLITHEYTHILHLDMVHGVADALQYIFGRLYFPNLFEPIWTIEGLAVYEETEQTSGGRGRSPGADMILRMASLEGPFPTLDKMSVFPDSWPSGQVPYLFGGSFARYIAEKYGREKLAELSEIYSGRALPFLVESTANRVLDRSYDSLWFEWEESLKAQYKKQEQEVRLKGLTESTALTRKGYDTVAPAFSPDGNRIAYAVSNADEYPGIYLMDTDGTHDHKIVENTTSSTSSGQSIAWGPDGSGIYYTKNDIVRNTDVYNDVYFFDLKRRKEVRITQGLRARDPYPSPDGKKFVFVVNKLGKTRIGTADIPRGTRGPVQEQDVTWLSEESASQYETPRFSPDGRMIVVGIWQPGGYKDIWILDSRGNKTEELMHDRAFDGGAVWNSDGSIIYFTSDRTGIFNLYAYELSTRKISRVTNVLGGAFTPAPSPDGKSIAFSSYSARGYDIHLQPMQQASWSPAEPYVNSYPSVTYNDKPVETKAGPYNPLPTLAPRFWLPWYGSSAASNDLWGFLTFGQDAVERHSYVLTGLYSPTTYRTWYSFAYAYDGFYPTVQVAASDLDMTFASLLADPIGTADYVQRERTLDVALVVPLLKNLSQHSLTIGYRRKEVSALTSLPPWPGYSGPVPAEGIFASGHVSYLFNNAHQYSFSISPEGGRTVEIGYENFDKSLGSDFTLSKYTADWHEYISFPWKHHVLLARVFGGTSEGDVIPQRAFQLGGDNPGNTTIPVDTEIVYLRGYPVNAFRGRKAALASLEYRFPVRNIESGFGTVPVFLRRLHGALFAEAGNAWDGSFRSSDFKRAIGGELRLDTTLAYYLPITFRFVVAKGLDDKGESFAYISLWLPTLL
jgi:Tol biopolymer transport system component